MVGIGLVSAFLLCLLVISLCRLERAMAKDAGADANMCRILDGQSCRGSIPKHMRIDGNAKGPACAVADLLIDRHLGLGRGLRGDLEVILYGSSPAS